MYNLHENIAIFILLTCVLRAHVNISLILIAIGTNMKVISNIFKDQSSCLRRRIQEG
jgi:hypothetical protein